MRIDFRNAIVFRILAVFRDNVDIGNTCAYKLGFCVLICSLALEVLSPLTRLASKCSRRPYSKSVGACARAGAPNLLLRSIFFSGRILISTLRRHHITSGHRPSSYSPSSSFSPFRNACVRFYRFHPCSSNTALRLFL